MKGGAVALALAWSTALAAGEGAPALPSAGPRESITFILGQDEEASRPLYAMADRYYRLDPGERTDHVQAGLRSLAEVRDFLAAHPPLDGRPWGVVNLVVHGNASGLLESPVWPGGGPATPELLSKVLAAKALAPVPDTVLDAKSELRVLGCSLGQRPRMLTLLSRAFGGEDSERPLVRSSLLFMGFTSDERLPAGCGRCLWEAWTLPFRPGARPSATEAAARLQALDPRAGMDWRTAITRDHPLRATDCYAYEQRAEFHYTMVYPGEAEAPGLQNPGGSLRRLMENQGFQEALGRAGTPWNLYRWRVERTRYRTPEGASLPALVATGTAACLIVLRPQADADPADPALRRLLRPSWEDPRFFASSR
ncbi:MAG TPA: hypothetical protein VJ600_09455 [Holophagaceae bacterium]|nr:hypothetical protein [Holophagaceae bacterium]